MEFQLPAYLTYAKSKEIKVKIQHEIDHLNKVEDAILQSVIYINIRKPFTQIFGVQQSILIKGSAREIVVIGEGFSVDLTCECIFTSRVNSMEVIVVA